MWWSWLRFKKREILFIGFLIAVFVGIRSIHFTGYLNFSTDQALFSTKALEIYQNRSLLLIGPTFSINLNGRYAFQGSVIYYFQLFFLVLGGFDPVKASYAFMVFCSLMTVPLYAGVKWLINKRAAMGMVIIYTLFPFYINYTRFLWNPNFQLALLPILILFMGLYKKTEKTRYLFAVAVLCGVIVQFHYQFGLIILALWGYYLVTARRRGRIFGIWLAGLAIGFSPILIFELRHHFYNLETVLLFLKYRGQVGNSPLQVLADYYFLSLSFFGWLVVAALGRNVRWPIVPLFAVLLFTSLALYLPNPGHGFRMAKWWKYEDELKAHQIIMGEDLKDYNIANLIYDTKAATQKYLLRKDNTTINFEDYYTNKYLFILNKDEQYVNDPAYEVNTFRPSTVLKQWKINDHFNLYLLERQL